MNQSDRFLDGAANGFAETDPVVDNERLAADDQHTARRSSQ